jgi:hypothetical protein
MPLPSRSNAFARFAALDPRIAVARSAGSAGTEAGRYLAALDPRIAVARSAG